MTLATITWRSKTIGGGLAMGGISTNRARGGLEGSRQSSRTRRSITLAYCAPASKIATTSEAVISGPALDVRSPHRFADFGPSGEVDEEHYENPLAHTPHTTRAHAHAHADKV